MEEVVIYRRMMISAGRRRRGQPYGWSRGREVNDSFARTVTIRGRQMAPLEAGSRADER